MQKEIKKSGIPAQGRREKTILVTIVANLLLVGLKYWLAGISGSLALRASAWHSLGDVFVSVFVLAGFYTSRLKFAKSHHVILVENAVALIVAGFMFYSAFDIFRDVTGGNEVIDLRYIWPVAIGSFLTILITYFTARYKEYVGKATNSISLLASGYHSRMDLYASVLVVVSLVATAMGIGVLDRLAASVVIILIVAAGWEIAESSISALKKGGLLRLQEDGIVGAHFHGKRPLILVGSILLIFALLSGLYSIQLGDQAVIRRLGKVAGTTGPGLHYRIPFLDQVTTVNVDNIKQVETSESLVLTGDTNLINAKLSIQYKITNPADYLFNVADTQDLILKEAEASLRMSVAAKGVDELLTAGRKDILAQTQSKTQELLNEHRAGLQITNIQLLSVTPPTEVADAFRDVSSAREDKNTYINEALAYQNETVAIARGEASKQTQTADAAKSERINIAGGEANRFTNKLTAYSLSPDVTRTRLYLESLEKVLPDINKFVLASGVETDSTDLWLTNSISPGQNTGQQTQPSGATNIPSSGQSYSPPPPSGMGMEGMDMNP